MQVRAGVLVKRDREERCHIDVLEIRHQYALHVLRGSSGQGDLTEGGGERVKT
jgi:hypothetical protein